jgi:hypothetical protein
MPLNAAQRDSLTAVSDTYVDAFGDVTATAPMLHLETVLVRLKQWLENAAGGGPAFALHHGERSNLRAAGALDELDQLVRIANHPCPQNRGQGSPYCGQDEGYVNGFDEGNQFVCREVQGLLSLTSMENPPGRAGSRQDRDVVYDSPDRVSRRDVIDFMAARLNCALSELRARIMAGHQEEATREARVNSDMQVAARMEHGLLLETHGKLIRSCEEQCRRVDHLTKQNAALKAEVADLKSRAAAGDNALGQALGTAEMLVGSLRTQVAQRELPVLPQPDMERAGSGPSWSQGIISAAPAPAGPHEPERPSKRARTEHGPFGSRLLDAGNPAAVMAAADEIWYTAPTLGENDAFRDRCAADGTCVALVKALTTAQDNAVQEKLCKCILTMARSAVGKAACVSAGAPAAVVKVLNATQHEGTQENACSALWNMAMSEEGEAACVSAGAPAVTSWIDYGAEVVVACGSSSLIYI